MRIGLVACLVGIVIIVSIFCMQDSFGQYYVIHHTTLVLDPIPRTLVQGDLVTFSGKLFTSDDKTPLQDRLVFIQYDNPYDCTRTLASTTTDSNGDYSVSWTAKPKGISWGTYNLFAKFNGDDSNFYSISKQYMLDVKPVSFVDNSMVGQDVALSFSPCV
ncbi:MAG: hypothetical protein KGI25_05265 [Thaumarchaeota archaeon]|nr:hypothetical protein [Nitrososphaerota archaeon]